MTPDIFLSLPDVYERVKVNMAPFTHFGNDDFQQIVKASVLAYDQFRRESVVAGCDQVREFESDVQS